MKTDIRVNTELFSHPKYKRLLRRLNWCGCAHLPHLFAWVAANRPGGDLAGLSDEDLELAINYPVDGGPFIATLAEIGFLDGPEGERRVHDWAAHQPWAAGSALRAAKARWSAIKRHYNEAEADRQVPEWAAARNAGSNQNDASSSATSSADSSAASNANSNACSTTAAMLRRDRSNAPSPSPSPSPSPKSKPIAQRAARRRVEYSAEFERFWKGYPNPKGKAVAYRAWEQQGLDSRADDLIADVQARLASDRDWRRDGGQYIPHASTYVNQRRWEDGIQAEQQARSSRVEAWEIAE